MSTALYKSGTKLLQQVRFNTTAVATGQPEKYNLAARWLHWIMAGGLFGCWAFVKMAQNTPKEDMETKIKYMKLHKSFGLAMLGAVVPRLAIALFAKKPAALPGPALEQLAGKLSHVAFYGLMLFMPISGVVMGYYGGNGLPFFGYNIPGASPEEQNKKLAGQAYRNHKLVGYWGQFLVPLHVLGAGFHFVKGQKIFSRINPFSP
eukprot:TRINITY_DN13380_c0_g1_i1.p1 TRINITY_DN13380_c0_g1~~TRINITY_DN13380_c0_g1_i1.p1  ORF type:complete len:232 (-),score=46.45 TRINITY_DN13380_c0_g1_i1:33-647(-)